MRVLVAYASRHGATRGIAERIAGVLDREQFDVTIASVSDAIDVDDHEAFVIGSAAYMGRWLGEAARFVREHRARLSRSPVWLFSSGPVGTETVDKQGRDVTATSRPAEFVEFSEAFALRDERVFFGAYDPDQEPANAYERLARPFLRLPAVRGALPAGDYRDWTAIEEWARSIAADLRHRVATVPSGV